MSDEIKHSEGDTPSPDKKSDQKKPGVGLYLVILFIAAFLLLLMAYFMQQRATDAQTINTLRESITSIESLDALIEENRTLHEKLDLLEDTCETLESGAAEQEQQIVDLTEQTEALKQTVLAWETFYQLETLYLNGDYEACAQQIEKLYAEQTVTIPLPLVERFEQMEAALTEDGYFTDTED